MRLRVGVVITASPMADLSGRRSVHEGSGTAQCRRRRVGAAPVRQSLGLCTMSVRRRWRSSSWLSNRNVSVSLATGMPHLREHTRAIFFHNMADHRGLYAVDDVVALAGDKVAISQNLYIILDEVSA